MTIRRLRRPRRRPKPAVAVEPDNPFDPVVIDLNKPTDRRVDRSRSELPLGILLGDESDGVIGVGVDADCNLLPEMALSPLTGRDVAAQLSL